MEIRQHPTVQQFYAIHPQGETRNVASIDSEMLRSLCLEAGADDAGFVGVDDPAVAPQRADIDCLMPGTQTLISFVCRMNKENIRTPARSISNLEFHIQTDETNVVAQKIVSRLEALKIRASIAGAAGFPMEADRFGGKPWTIDSRSALDYRKKVSNAETQSMWQSLSYGANYKAAYCMAVCPAGEDVIGPPALPS